MTPTQNMRKRMLRVLLVEKKAKYIPSSREKKKQTEKSKHWNLFKQGLSVQPKKNKMGLIPEKMNESKGHEHPFLFF
jgi:hypothetical protein